VGGYLILRPAKRKKYKSTPAARGEILSQVSATGTVNPIDRVVVGTQVSGILDTVLVDFNDFVKAGQVLARIDPRSYQAALQQASANLTSAQLSLAQAQRDYVHAETLAKANLISGDQLFQAQTSCELARTKLEQGQASYDQAVTNLAYTTITAPMSGLVIARKVESGQTVAASFSAPELFNIADLSRMQVEVSIQEADVGKLDTGLLATFKVDAYPDQTFQGRLVQIRNEPITDQNVVTYIGIVRVDNPEFLLKPGMTADVKIEITHVQNVLVVPSSALNPKMGSLLGLEQARTGTGAAGRPGAGNTGAGARTAEGNPAGSSGTSGAQARAGGAHVARPVRGSPAGDSLPPGTKPAGGKTRTVYVLEKGVPAPRPVELGANDSYNTEIKSGLKEGELVILGLDQAKVNPFQQQGRPPGGGFR
jgi:HlyD family secretion protein